MGLIITITGPCASGKTTFASSIARGLRASGIKVTIINPDIKDGAPERSPERDAHCLGGLINGYRPLPTITLERDTGREGVVIETIQPRREPVVRAPVVFPERDPWMGMPRTDPFDMPANINKTGTA